MSNEIKVFEVLIVSRELEEVIHAFTGDFAIVANNVEQAKIAAILEATEDCLEDAERRDVEKEDLILVRPFC